MRIDLDLFPSRENRNKPSVLRFYSWQPQCISLGYSQKIEEEIDLLRAKELGWEMVKRPTGGGIVFHNEAEVTYSLVTAINDPLLPPGLIPSYRKISEAIVAGLIKVGVKAEVGVHRGPRGELELLQVEPRARRVVTSAHEWFLLGEDGEGHVGDEREVRVQRLKDPRHT